jgi:Ca2+-binding EF-hand superfamily protein
MLAMPAVACFLPGYRPFAPMPGLSQQAASAISSTPVAASSLPRALFPSMSSEVEEICEAIPDSEVCDAIEADANAVFAIIDVNGDGGISREELMSHLTKAGYNEKAVGVLFDKLDTNKDDEISKEELTAGFLKYTPLRSAPGLGAYNANFVDEIHADADALFAALDADGSGAISKEELRNHLKQFSDYSFKAIGNIFKVRPLCTQNARDPTARVAPRFA